MKLNNKFFLLFSFVLIAVLLPESAMAATQTLGDMAIKTEENIKSIKQLSLSVFYMIGLFLFGAGLFLLYKDQKTPNQGHAKNGFVSIIIGTCLLLIPQLVAITTTTIGADANESKKALESAKGF